MPPEFPNYKVISSNEIDKIKNNANSYRLFRNAPDNIKLKLISNQNNLMVIRKISEYNSLQLGDILIYQIHGKCSIKQFSNFMKLVKEHADSCYNGDLMSVEPLIIAESYENIISFFVDNYNKFETIAQRVPIIMYTLAPK